LRDYELTVVFNPEIAEEDLPAEIERVNELIAQKGGVVGEANRWGRRRLAYPIKRHREGNYVLTPLKLQADVAAELERNLRGFEQILRYLLVKVE
jgi:small subunit ribosomal protein S6